MLARAFQDDPLAIYMLPKEHDRARLLPAHFTAVVKYGHLAGEVWTTEGRVDGVAVWLPPGHVEMHQDRMEQAGLTKLPSIIGADAVMRFTKFLEYLDPLRKRDASALHWYAMVIGVDPEKQGKGVGSYLLQPVLARTDSDGRPCYLETVQLNNVPFYRKHGFQTIVEDVEPKSGLRFWTFRRDPQASKTLSEKRLVMQRVSEISRLLSSSSLQAQAQ